MFQLKNNYISHTKHGVLLLHVFALLILSSCKVYNLSNEKKYRNWFPVDDEYIVDKNELNEKSFDISQFLNTDTSQTTQFIFPEDLKKIRDSLDKDLLVVFYFPNCSGADKDVDIAKFSGDNNIPVILISDTYSPKRMLELNTKYQLANKNQYIIPTIDKKQRFLLQKKVNFIKLLSPDLYLRHRDDLIFTTLLIMSKDGKCEVNPLLGNGFTNKEILINWIKEKYRLTD